MNKQLMKMTLLLVTCIMALVGATGAQPVYRLSGQGQSMRMSGTSTLHKWTMSSETFSSDAQFRFKTGNELASLHSLVFTLPVTTLKSGEKKLDKNAYKALKTEAHSNIVYKLTSASISMVATGNYLIKTHGDLNIAGVTKNVAMDVYCTVNTDGSITCKGSNKMNMSDYDVTPPSFMAGAMKTGDAITLDFKMVYKQ